MRLARGFGTSAATARRDEGVKRRRYEHEGVRHYVAVSIDDRRVLALRHDGERFADVSGVPADPLDSDRLSCPFSPDLSALLGALRL